VTLRLGFSRFFLPRIYPNNPTIRGFNPFSLIYEWSSGLTFSQSPYMAIKRTFTDPQLLSSIATMAIMSFQDMQDDIIRQPLALG